MNFLFLTTTAKNKKKTESNTWIHDDFKFHIQLLLNSTLYVFCSFGGGFMYCGKTFTYLYAIMPLKTVCDFIKRLIMKILNNK